MPQITYEEILSSFLDDQVTEFNEKCAEEYYSTPCDYPDENGNYHCPYEDSYTGYESEMCRTCCGLGVDE